MTAMVQRLRGWFGGSSADALPVRLGQPVLGRSGAKPVRLSDFDHALIWVVVGSIFVGGIHDFGSLVASIRLARRKSREGGISLMACSRRSSVGFFRLVSMSRLRSFALVLGRY